MQQNRQPPARQRGPQHPEQHRLHGDPGAVRERPGESGPRTPEHGSSPGVSHLSLLNAGSSDWNRREVSVRGSVQDDAGRGGKSSVCGIWTSDSALPAPRMEGGRPNANIPFKFIFTLKCLLGCSSSCAFQMVARADFKGRGRAFVMHKWPVL
jgi:hypothetical protein